MEGPSTSISVGLELQGLLGLGGQDDLAVDDEGRAHVLLGDLLVVVQGGFLKDDLAGCLKQLPSLSSMKPKFFMSRMVLAQPQTVTS